MWIPKWEVGDVVMVRPDLRHDQNYIIGIARSMEQYAGMRVVITEVDLGNLAYRVASCETGRVLGFMTSTGWRCPWLWSEDTLIEAVDDPKLDEDSLFDLLGCASSERSERIAE